jgi:hypothetical protein
VGPLDLCIRYVPLSVGHSPTSSFDGFVSSISVFFDQYYIYYYFVYNLISNLIEWLGSTWILVFSVGGHIRVWILLCFIILFSLANLFEISVCLKGFLLWPLVGTERLSFVIIFIFSFADCYLILAIWQLKTYSIPFDLYSEVDYQIQQTRVRTL